MSQPCCDLPAQEVGEHDLTMMFVLFPGMARLVLWVFPEMMNISGLGVDLVMAGPPSHRWPCSQAKRTTV